MDNPASPALKIAEVCPYDIDRPGGVQQHILDLTRALRTAGHAVRIIAPGPAPPLEQRADAATFYAGRLRAARLNGTCFETSRLARDERVALTAHLATERYDLVHFHTLLVPWLPYAVLRLSRAAHVATFHDTPPDTRGGDLSRLVFGQLARWLAPRLDRVLAVSPAPARHLGGIPRARFALLPPAVDLARFAEPAMPLAGPRDERLTVLCLGRLEPRKSVADLLDAGARLLADGVPLRLLVVGNGPLREAIAARAAQLPAGSVELRGPVSEDDKARLFASADIYCAPARHGESFGLVLAEAMASGLPAVAAANHGYRHVLAGPGARFLYPPGDCAALGARLRLLVEDAGLRRAHADWGRTRALGFDVSAQLPNFLEVFAQALVSKRERDGNRRSRHAR